MSSAPGGGSFERVFRTRLARVSAPLDAGAVASVLTAVAAWWVLRMPFVAQPSVPIELPETTMAEGVRYDTVIVAVSADGQMYAGDRPVNLEALSRYFELAVRERPDTSVLIEADRRVPHHVVVRICDVAARHGIQRAAVATQISPLAPPNLSP